MPHIMMENGARWIASWIGALNAVDKMPISMRTSLTEMMVGLDFGL